MAEKGRQIAESQQNIHTQLSELHRLVQMQQQGREEAQERALKWQAADYNSLQTRQIETIGNIFISMVKHMSSTAGGKEEEPAREASVAKGPAKPQPFRVNTLRMMELPQEDIATLIKLGFSDIIHKIGVQKHRKVDL